MQYMVIERFKEGDPLPVYRRARKHGRLTPENLEFVDSWVDSELGRCFQIMRCDDRALLDEWMENWSDLVDFEIIPVLSTDEVLSQLEEQL